MEWQLSFSSPIFHVYTRQPTTEQHFFIGPIKLMRLGEYFARGNWTDEASVVLKEAAVLAESSDNFEVNILGGYGCRSSMLLK